MSEVTVANATDEQVWPDVGFRPSPAMCDEIRAVAQTITAREVAASGLTWAPWYIKFVLAEHRVEDRHKQLAAEQKRAEENAARAAPAKPATAVKYPTVSAWAKPIKYVRVIEDRGSPKELRCEEFRKEWYGEGRAVPVFRRDVAANAGMSINDGRKLFRTIFAAISESNCISTFIVREANERIADLEKKVEELERRKMPEYKGVWKPDQEYGDNSLVTHDGSMFIARAQSKGVRPGDGSLWTLCVKRGRDARAPALGAVARKDAK